MENVTAAREKANTKLINVTKNWHKLSHSLRYEGMVAYIFYIKVRGIKIT